MLLVRQAPPSANGMVFATIEDETGLTNLVLTPPVYQAVRRIFDNHAFLCAAGRLQRQDGAHSVKVSQVFTPKIPDADVIRLGEQGGAAREAVKTVHAAIMASRSYC